MFIAFLVADEESVLTGAAETYESQRTYDVGELISFASFDIPIETNLQGPTTNSLFNDDCFDPFNLYGNSSASSFNPDINGGNLSLFDHYAPATGSNFHDDPFATTSQSSRETNLNNSFFIQPQPQLIPCRVSTPTPTISTIQSLPITLKNLSVNPTNKKNETVTDLLDFGDPFPPPSSPKFDPYA